MSRKAPVIGLTAEERKQLEQLVNKPSTAQAISLRARIILLAAGGMANKEIHKALQVNKNVVNLWRRRFHEERLEGLKDRPGRGRKRIYGHDERLKVIAKGCEKPPEAQRWKEIDLKPHKVQMWLTSKDPDFECKAAEICGLYLNPPENALVISVDEKTGIQAVGRKYADKPERPGSLRKREFEYKRHGTVSLFAAFVVHSGEVIAEVKERHTRVEFIDFLEEVNRQCPKDRMIHVIVDNLAVHKTPEVKDWLSKHGRFEFHFTPTHASWLNQIEMWFSILARRFLKDGIFNSKEELVQGLMNYIKSYNEHPKAFRWTCAADPLRI